jgi:hypothetical protein
VRGVGEHERLEDVREDPVLDELEAGPRRRDHALAAGALGDREAPVVRRRRDLARVREKPQLPERHLDRRGEIGGGVQHRQLGGLERRGVGEPAVRRRPQPGRYARAEISELACLGLLRALLRRGALAERALLALLATPARLRHALLLEVALELRDVAHAPGLLAQRPQAPAQLVLAVGILGGVAERRSRLGPETEPDHLVEDDFILAAASDALVELLAVFRWRQVVGHERGGWLPSSTLRTGLLCSSGRDAQVPHSVQSEFQLESAPGRRWPHSIERASEACRT